MISIIVYNCHVLSIITFVIGSDHPQLKYLNRIKSLFAEKWYDLGLELLEPGDEHQLRLIKSNKLGKDESCREMLDLWTDRQPNASWNQLIDALRSPGVEMNNVASKIQNLLSNSVEGTYIYLCDYVV